MRLAYRSMIVNEKDHWRRSRSPLPRSIERQREPEFRRTGPAGMQPHASAMRFHDGSTDRKAESQAILLCRCERIEQATCQFALDARSIVQHADLDARRRGLLARHDMNVPMRLARRGDRIHGVMDEIEHDLLQLHLITMNSGKSAGASRSMRTCFADASASAKVSASWSMSTRVDRAHMRMPATNEIPHAPHDVAGVVDVRQHGC